MTTIPNKWGFPDLGLGIGLRSVHYPHILEHSPKIDWFEIISENYMETEGRPLQIVEEIAERYAIVMHGVSMSIGSTDPINWDYMEKLKKLAARVNAKWLGDHLCWTGVAGKNGHDLYPVPTNEESLKWVVGRIRQIQDFLERPLVIENPSTYVSFTADSMSEEEFLARMAEDSDCALLLDVNNVYVSSRNHGFDPIDYLEKIPLDRVVQIHLAGHTDKETHCIDTHDGVVIDEVWRLYDWVMKRAGNRSTLLEWDDEIPSFEEVHNEVLRAEQYRSDGVRP